MTGSREVLQEQVGIGNHPGPVSEGSLGGGEVPPRVLGELVRVVSSHWTRGYEILGPAATTAGMAVMGISLTEMLVSTAARAVIL